MGEYNFKNDLEKSDETTKEIISWLWKKHKIKVLQINTDYQYDLKCYSEFFNKEFTVEVKEDFYCAKSGNVALEYECRGKPSGIATTKANFYLYVVHAAEGARYYLLKKSTLNRMVKDELYDRIVCGGDRGSNTYNYLFKLEVFADNADSVLDF